MLTVVLKERPLKEIEVGKTFGEEIVDAPTEADLQDGQVLFQAYYLSIDPTYRGWLIGELHALSTTRPP
jgi:NADPH-dependent curcumin reductase CurA